MKTYLECYPCFLRQALDAAEFAHASDAEKTSVVQATLALLQTLDPQATPPEIGDEIHRLVRATIRHEEPYGELKQAATEAALQLLPWMRSQIAHAPDPFERAVRIAIAGNIIDFGPGASYDLERALSEVTQKPCAINDLEALRGALANSESVLYLADNAGEIVFDKLLVEALPRDRVTLVVRGVPVLNDVTHEDAVVAGLHEVAEVIDNGADAPGTILEETSPAFRQRFREADLIIAKGQGNFETLSEVEAPIYYLLTVKCPAVGAAIGAPVGAMVVKPASELNRSTSV